MGDRLQVLHNHKDNIFRMLYREKKELLELYNALNGTDYTDEGELEVFRLENAIYMNIRNDVSFLLSSELNLYEQQSSYNPNMPLRDLGYIAHLLEKYTRDMPVYSDTLVRIPVPRFVVFYNGTRRQPERKTLRLSDAYEKAVENPDLELKVLMLNINLGKNRELMEKSKTLLGYSILVNRIRVHLKEKPIHEAADLAVTECIREGVLADFLSQQRAEVVAMSIFEYDEERERQKLGDLKFRQGEEAGMKKGMEKGVKKGMERGLKEGLEAGRKKGIIEGTVSTLAELGYDWEEIVAKIMEKYGLTREEADGYR